MTLTPSISIYGKTDVGLVREGNEDGFLIQPINGKQGNLNPDQIYEIGSGKAVFLAVSDGMGGAAAGELASRTALEEMSRWLAQHQDQLRGAEPEEIAHILEKGIGIANQTIITKAEEAKGRRGMGATMTALYLEDHILYLLQVGDSRAYVLREGNLTRITRDQSFVGHLVEMGTISESQAMKHPQRSVILQALGTQTHIKPDISFQPLCKNDLVIVCSDGLYSELLPEDLSREIGEGTGDLKNLVEKLVNVANQAGGKDNITVIAMRVGDDAPIPEPDESPKYQAFPFLDRDNPFERSQSLFQ